MAGVAGALAAELLGQGDWYEAPQWVRPLSSCSAHSMGAHGASCCVVPVIPGASSTVVSVLTMGLPATCMQAITGGTPQYLGIPVPFNLSTLLAIVRELCACPYAVPCLGLFRMATPSDHWK